MPAESRPSPYQFHDVREYLKEIFKYKKSEISSFSLRGFGLGAGLSSAHLTLIMSGRRSLTADVLEKLLPSLGVADHEAVYIRSLRDLSEATTQKDRLVALKKVQRSLNYREQAPAEFETYQYLSKWYLPAMRELAVADGFKPDPKWIQKRLRRRVALSSIRKGWDFLVKHGFVEKGAGGRWVFPENKMINCMGGVMRLSMGTHHQDMLQMAVESIEELPREQRDIQGFTIAADVATFDKVRELLNETFTKIESLTRNNQNRKQVIYVGSVLFPLTDDGKL
jgi:uncharacterized protein (TIGR02147 family)